MILNIASYSFRIWSGRSLAPASPGVALAAIYLFDKSGKHIGTVSFFPNSLGAQNLLPPALSGDVIELRRLFEGPGGFEETRTTLGGVQASAAGGQASVAGGQASIYYNSPQDAGIRTA